VEEILGVPPSKVVDGDGVCAAIPVDNIPGAPGIGDKGFGGISSSALEA